MLDALNFVNHNDHMKIDLTTICLAVAKVQDVDAFAQRAGVSRRTVFRLRKGWSNPTFEVLRKVADQLEKDAKK